MSSAASLADAFWALVDTSDPLGCWPWLGRKDRDGYGKFSFKKQYYLAHRLAWELIFGSEPDSLVLHRCDNPSCCNPDCLFLGSHADNVADKVAKGRQARGEKNGGAKLSLAEVDAIKERLSRGETQTSLAREYGVSQSAISFIHLDKKWRKGLASQLWPRYDPHPAPAGFVPKIPIRLVTSDEKLPLPDPSCDYIEGAEWWIARSDTSVRTLQRAFEDQEVACLLFETVGAMFEIGRTASGQYLIAIQVIGAGQWDVDLSLSDAGIYLEEPAKACALLDPSLKDSGRK